MKRSNLSRMATVLIAVAVFAAACGDDSNEPAAAPDTAPTEEPAAGNPVRMGMSIPGPNLYFDNYDNALQDLDELFGFEDTEYTVGTEWSLNAQNISLNALMGKDFNAIGLFPGDPEATNTQMQLMKDRVGTLSVLIGGCTNDPSPALFCIATDVYLAAYDAAVILIEQIGGEGKIAHLSSNLTDPNTELRKQGAEAAVAETDGAVEIVQFIGDTDVPDQAPRIVESLLAARGDELAGVLATAWYPTEALAAWMQANPEDRDIVVVGEDASMVAMNAIRDGVIYGTMFQNSYGQSYVAGYVMAKIVGEGCTLRDDIQWDDHPQTARFIDSGHNLVFGDNVDEFFAAADDDGVIPETSPAITEALLAEADSDWLDCP